MIPAVYKPGDIVRLTARLVRNSGRVILPVDWHMKVKKVTRCGGSPEYTVEDDNGDVWVQIPQSRLALVATAHEADEYEPEYEGSLF